MSIIRLYYFIPIFLITGPFLPDLLISLTSIYFLYFFIKNEKNILTQKVSLLFWFFYFLIVILSLFSNDIFLSLKSTIPYFRFFMFSLIICFALEKKILKIEIFYFIIILIISIFFVDSFVQFSFDKNIIGQVSPLDYRITSFFGDKAVL